MPYTDNGGVRLYWEQGGQGTPLLLIQGLGLGARLWYRILPALEAHHRVIRYDPRGIDRSDVPEGPYPIDLMAADAIAVLDAAGAPAAHVYGLSLGGLVAQELAIAHADRVRSLMLCGTLIGGLDSVWADAEVLEMLQRNAALDPEASVRASIPFAYADGTDRAHIEEDIQLRLAHPTSREGYVNQLMGSGMYPGNKSRLPNVTLPALVITGDADRIAPPANAQILGDALPNSTVVVIPGGGHVLLTDQPAALTTAMLEFMAKVDAA